MCSVPYPFPSPAHSYTRGFVVGDGRIDLSCQPNITWEFPRGRSSCFLAPLCYRSNVKWPEHRLEFSTQSDSPLRCTMYHHFHVCKMGIIFYQIRKTFFCLMLKSHNLHHICTHGLKAGTGEKEDFPLGQVMAEPFHGHLCSSQVAIAFMSCNTHSSKRPEDFFQSDINDSTILMAQRH